GRYRPPPRAACYGPASRRNRARPMRPTASARRPPVIARIRSRRRRQSRPTGSKGRTARSSIEPAREQVEQNEDGVADALALGERIGSVFDGDWPLDVAQSAGGDLTEPFRR